MLLRYIALHGNPKTTEDWENFRKWKEQQLALSECHMSDPEGAPAENCAGCPGSPNCPKGVKKA